MARIAYYLWRFPTLSETFIQREVRALAARGVDLTVIADSTGVTGGGDGGWTSAIPPVRYLKPMPWTQLVSDLVATSVRHPVRMLRLAAYLVSRTYQSDKRLADDARVFVKSVHLGAVLRRSRIEHVHAPWGDTTALVAMLAAWLADIRFSVQFRAHDLHRRDAAYLIADKVQRACFVVTNTDFNVRALAARLDSAQAGKIRRIYNGLELDRIPVAQLRQRLDGTIVILCVGRLIEPKGLPDLFAACRVLRERGHAVRCRVIGGPELPRYAADAQAIEEARTAFGVQDIVDLAGALPFTEVAGAYAASDLFALPCVVGRDGAQDITPNALLEAMAAGLPVVSTTITAIPELVEHDVTGLLVPPRDAKALADALELLITDPDRRMRLGDAARQRVREKFDVDGSIGAYAELFAGAGASTARQC